MCLANTGWAVRAFRAEIIKGAFCSIWTEETGGTLSTEEASRMIAISSSDTFLTVIVMVNTEVRSVESLIAQLTRQLLGGVWRTVIWIFTKSGFL